MDAYKTADMELQVWELVDTTQGEAKMLDFNEVTGC
jgi:hypothetical protein